ncbi:hypothetical protein ACLKA7_004473 [Drosophila subpalustris]
MHELLLRLLGFNNNNHSHGYANSISNVAAAAAATTSRQARQQHAPHASNIDSSVAIFSQQQRQKIRKRCGN